MATPYDSQLKDIQNKEKITISNLEKQKTNSKKLLFVKVANNKLKCKACGYESERKIKCNICGKIGLRRERPGKCTKCGTYLAELTCGHCGAKKDATLTSKISLKIKETKAYFSFQKKEIKKAISLHEKQLKKQKALLKKASKRR